MAFDDHIFDTTVYMAGFVSSSILWGECISNAVRGDFLIPDSRILRMSVFHYFVDASTEKSKLQSRSDRNYHHLWSELCRYG